MNDLNGQMLPPDIPASAIAQPVNTTEKNNKFDSRNYLNYTIPEGQTSHTVKIRLLPVEIDETGTPQLFKIIHMHSMKVHKDLKPNQSGKKSYVCLKKNKTLDQSKFGTKCPICEEESRLWEAYKKETDPTKKEELRVAAGALGTREYCIVRCIERGKEEDGPKFWRFMVRKDNSDPYHRLLTIAEQRKQEGIEAGMDINVFSIYNGKDFNVTFTDGNSAPTIVDVGFSTRLTNDDALLQKWYYDEKKWNDVFGIKPYEYLKIAYNLDVPYYDKNKGVWVRKSEFESQKAEQENTEQQAINQAEAYYTQSTPVVPTVEIPVTPTPVVPNPTVPGYDIPAPGYNNYSDDLPY